MKLMYFIGLLLLGSTIPFSIQDSSSSYIYFDVDDHTLSSESMQVLDQLYSELEKHSDYNIQIVGHTDQDGSELYNEALAQRRTESVKEYLTVMGYPTEKLSVDWKGESQLLVNDDTRSAKQKNRRVELKYQYWDFEDVEDLVTSVAEDTPQQKFTCDNKAQFFDLQNGTSVYIPAGAFEFKNGNQHEGPIELEIIEAFRYTDMIANNLITSCKDELLETGGMVYINATADGAPLQLIEGRQIEFIFPVQKEEEGMELFYGEEVDGTITWNETGENVRTTQVKNDPLSIDFTPIVEYDFGEIVKPTIQFEEMPPRPRRMDKPYPPSKHTYHGEKYEEMYASYEKRLDAYNNQLPILEKAEEEWQAEVTKRILAIEEFKREITRFQYSGKLFNAVRSLTKMENRRAPVELISNLFSFMNRPFAVKLDQRVTFKKAFGNYTRDVVQERSLEVMQKVHQTTVGKNYYPDLKALIFDTRRLAQEEAFALNGTIDYKEFSSYIMGISELGWVNCDRFRRAEETTSLTILNGERTAKYYMIFKDIRGILQVRNEYGEALFNNIPVGEDVKLVSVKLVDKKPLMAIQDHTIGYDDRVSLEYFPSSLKQIRTELNSIDPIYKDVEPIQDAKSEITMYPNPATIDFSLITESDTALDQINVYDLSGALIKSIDSSNNDSQKERVSVTDMDNGVYVVNARFADGGITSERIVVQR